jgi:serine O-acetyltransferase
VVEDNARVAAGAVVLHGVPSRATVAGVPARVIRVGSPDQPARPMDEILRDLGYEAFVNMI